MPARVALAAGLLASLAAVASLAACGDDGSTPPKDGAVDAPVDGPPGVCGADGVQLKGEIIDFNSDAPSEGFCGVFGAVLTVRATGTHIDPTPPNGRVALCIPLAGQSLIDVTQPTAASPCAAMPGKYEFPAVLVTTGSFAQTDEFSLRDLTTQATPTLYSTVGHVYDSTKAQLVIHFTNGPTAVTIDAPHDQALQLDGTWKTWTGGTPTGTDLFFPNITGTSTTVSFPEGGAGEGLIPLAAGTFTYDTIVRTPR
jgi:hypothetical protein